MTKVSGLIVKIIEYKLKTATADCIHCPSLITSNSFHVHNTVCTVQRRWKGHPTLHSALSTVVLFCHVRRGWRDTVEQCHQQEGRVDCSQLAVNRLTEEPLQSSVLETSCLWECPDRLLPDCWCCSGKFVSGRSPNRSQTTHCTLK